MKRFLAVVLLLVVFDQVSAQQFIYIKKGNEFPAVRYGIMDQVKFRTDKDLPWVSGLIREIGSDFVRIGNVVYPLDAIIAFRSKKELLAIGGTALWAGGIFFTGLALVNGIINNDQPVIKNSQLLWGGGLVLVGFGMMALSKKDYYGEDGWQWVVVDMNKVAE